jgi:excisionase family DNA binding protein
MRKQSKSVPQRLLRTKEAAEYLGVSRRKLRALVQDGQFPFVQFDEYGPWWIDLRDLDNFIDAAKQTAS